MSHHLWTFCALLVLKTCDGLIGELSLKFRGQGQGQGGGGRGGDGEEEEQGNDRRRRLEDQIWQLAQAQIRLEGTLVEDDSDEDVNAIMVGIGDTVTGCKPSADATHILGRSKGIRNESSGRDDKHAYDYGERRITTEGGSDPIHNSAGLPPPQSQHRRRRSNLSDRDSEDDNVSKKAKRELLDCAVDEEGEADEFVTEADMRLRLINDNNGKGWSDLMRHGKKGEGDDDGNRASRKWAGTESGELGKEEYDRRRDNASRATSFVAFEATLPKSVAVGVRKVLGVPLQDPESHDHPSLPSPRQPRGGHPRLSGRDLPNRSPLSAHPAETLHALPDTDNSNNPPGTNTAAHPQPDDVSSHLEPGSPTPTTPALAPIPTLPFLDLEVLLGIVDCIRRIYNVRVNAMYRPDLSGHLLGELVDVRLFFF